MTGLPALPLVPALGTMLASLVLAALLGARTQRRAGRDRGVRAGALVLLAGTTVTLMILTWAGLDSPGDGGVNLIPGAGIRAALVNVNTRLRMMNVLGNVALFVPIGFFAVLAGWNVSRAIAIAAGTSAAIEVVQFLLGRTVDIDDVVLIALGGAVGAVTARAVRLVRRTWAIPGPE